MLINEIIIILDDFHIITMIKGLYCHLYDEIMSSNMVSYDKNQNLNFLLSLKITNHFILIMISLYQSHNLIFLNM